MKIVLLRDEEPFWGSVRAYLVGLTASIVSQGDPERLAAERPAPDLVVTSRALAAEPSVRGLRMPVIAIDASGGDGRPAAGELGRSAVPLRWPLTKSAFLQATAAVLKLEPRREFRALMRVGVLGGRPDTLAESRDFSSSGMSFTSAGYFAEGSKIVISLSLPSEDRRLLMNGTVVRTHRDPAAGSNFHGVAFLSQDADTGAALRRFILS